MKKSIFFLTVMLCHTIISLHAQTDITNPTPKDASSKFTPKLSKGAIGLKPAPPVFVPPPPFTSTECGPDADADGVTDCRDQQSNTPVGCPVDVRGVSRDTDGDGVPDCNDKELVTPTSCQPVDSDGIGKCPDPEASIDTDGDGVPNSQDKELITPTYCQPVDADGIGKCPYIGPDARIATPLSLEQKLEEQQAEINSLKLQLQDVLSSLRKNNIAITNPNGPMFRAFSFSNPTQQQFAIQTQSSTDVAVSIRVTDVTGKLIEQKSGIRANTITNIGAGYQRGIYFVEVAQGSRKEILKLVKQ